MVTEYVDADGKVVCKTEYENGVLSYKVYVKTHKAWRTDFTFTKHEHSFNAQGMLKTDACRKYDLGSFNVDDQCVSTYIDDVADAYPGIKDIYENLCLYNPSLLQMSTLAQFMVNCGVSETHRFACAFTDEDNNTGLLKNVMYVLGKSSWRRAKPEVRKVIADNIIYAISKNKYHCVWTFRDMLTLYGGEFAPKVIKKPVGCYHLNELNDEQLSWLTDNCDDEPTEYIKNKYLEYVNFIRYSLFYVTQKNPDEGYDEYSVRVENMRAELSREPNWIKFDGLHRISKAMRSILPNIDSFLKLIEEYPDAGRFIVGKSDIENAIVAINRSRDLIKDYVSDYNEKLAELF